jgi:hypothetical protein
MCNVVNAEIAVQGLVASMIKTFTLDHPAFAE